MTFDTEAIRASGRLWGDNFALLTGHQVVALCDALDALTAERDAERERVKVLRAALRFFVNAAHTMREASRANDSDWVAQQIEQHRASCAAALAATDDGRTP
jgi:hypothetical protein